MPTGTPLASTRTLRLTPLLARSVGFFPVFFPPEGSLGHAAVHAQPLPVDALETVVLQEAGFPDLEKDPGLYPFLEAIMGRRAGTEFRGIQGFPLAPGAQDKEDGIHADSVGRAWPPTAKAVGIAMFGE
jgi:hypothetical protein